MVAPHTSKNSALALSPRAEFTRPPRTNSPFHRVPCSHVNNVCVREKNRDTRNYGTRESGLGRKETSMQLLVGRPQRDLAFCHHGAYDLDRTALGFSAKDQGAHYPVLIHIYFEFATL